MTLAVELASFVRRASYEDLSKAAELQTMGVYVDSLKFFSTAACRGAPLRSCLRWPPAPPR